jgi:hypothetical protein
VVPGMLRSRSNPHDVWPVRFANTHVAEGGGIIREFEYAGPILLVRDELRAWDTGLLAAAELMIRRSCHPGSSACGHQRTRGRGSDPLFAVSGTDPVRAS